MNAEFTCKFLASPSAKSVKWFKNDIEEIISNEEYEIITDETSTVLKKLNCQPSDSSTTFIVKIINDLGETTSNKATLNVTRGPVFELEPVDQKTLKDKEAKFECIIKSNPKPNIIWLMNDKEITAKDGIRVEKDANKDKYSIIIPKVTTVANFTVKASNEFGSIEKTCQLDVLGEYGGFFYSFIYFSFFVELPRIIGKIDNVNVNVGDVAKIVVKFYGGNPRPSFKWFKEDEEISMENSEILEAIDSVSLSINEAKVENGGFYYVRIMNDVGEIFSNKFQLLINS